MPIDFHKYKDIFLVEASSFIKIMNDNLLQLEKNPKQKKCIHEVQRAIHSLKGLASTMNYVQTMEVCHKVEDLFEEIMNKKYDLKIYINLLFKSFDFLEENIKSLAASDAELDAKNLISKIDDSIHNGHSALNDFGDLTEIPVTFEKIKTLAVKADKLDKLMNMAEELLVCKMKFDAIKEQLNHSDISPVVESLGHIISDLQYNIMQIRLVPIEFIFNRFLRMARDLAKQQKKEVNIQVEGGEIELDRLLIDELGESLVHLIRNAIDHGLEKPEVRKTKGKPAEGTITLCVSRTKESAIIEIKDDGEGLDLELIRKLAIQNNLIRENATNEEIIDAIFLNLSTKKNITTLSGRGLGLYIVKHKIDSIGGSIRVKSTRDKGTVFYIEIPLTLAIIKALFVRVAEEVYAIPIDAVERLLVVNPDDFKGMLEYEAIIYQNMNIPIIRLANVFKQTIIPLGKKFVIIIQKSGKRFGLVVDSLLSNQEVVIKPLGKAIKNNQYFSGAALTGSGKMVLILDLANLSPTKKIIHV